MAEKLKVLSIGHSYVVAMNRAILRELAEDPAFDVTIGAPAKFNGSLRTIEIEPEPRDSKLKIVPLRTQLSQKMHVFTYHPLDLRSLLNQPFDCAHIWEEPYILAGFQVMRGLSSRQIPFLFRTAQSLVKNYIFPFSYFEKFCFSKAKHFISGGHLVFEAMRKKGWQTPGQVLSLAVDTKAFKVFDAEQKKLKQKELGLKGPVICYLGRLSEEKGCDLFMEVLANLKHKEWSFLVMGSGPYKEKIEAWAVREGLQDRVQVRLFKHDEVPEVLPCCDLMIAPSQTRPFWKEQFGRMLVEAFASGVPVIASDSGEIPRVVDKAGVIVGETDIEGWQQAIARFLEEPESFKGSIENGFERAKTFSAQNIGEQYKDIYRQLAEK